MMMGLHLTIMLRDHSPESHAVVFVDDVGQFVDDDMIQNIRWSQQQPVGDHNIIVYRTAPPSGYHTAQRYFAKFSIDGPFVDILNSLVNFPGKHSG